MKQTAVPPSFRQPQIHIAALIHASDHTSPNRRAKHVKTRLSWGREFPLLGVWSLYACRATVVAMALTSPSPLLTLTIA